MKKLSILLLTLTVLLCGCDNDTAVTTAEVTATEATSAEATVTAAAETTSATETLPVVPAIEVPDVIDADSYEKEVVDILGYGGFDYPHSVKYPKIDSEKPGATALNEKIAERYAKIINELKNGNEGQNIYNISYSYSVQNGIIFIDVIEDTGWQYSEGMTTQKIFYYDAVNDKEMSAEEYAAHFGIDLEKAQENVVYTYELACSYMDDMSVIISGEDENAIYEPAAGILFPAKQTEFNYKFDGLEVTDSEVNLYYNGQQYVLSIYKFALDRETLEPKHPHYMGYVLPNDSDSDEVKITLENGTVTEYSIPAETEIYNIKISSTAVSVYSKVRLEKREISINGGESYTTGCSMYIGENQYQYDFYMKEYIPIEELKTIELTIESE